MANSNNMFYQLYSNSNNTMSSGYVCRSAVDEEDTSFDITDSNGVITDSNGDTLASIDMSEMSASGLTEYTTETKILQPYSAYLLQGPEQGLAYASYSYLIPDKIAQTSGYEAYVDIDFDIVYNTCNPLRYHVQVQADGVTSYVAAINSKLSEVQIPVQVSLQSKTEIEDFRQVTHQYLVFLAQSEGLFYYINNLRLVPEFQSEDYPGSPFSKTVGEMDTLIIQVINEYHPVQKGTTYVEGEYVPDCKLYKWLRENYERCIKEKSNFKQYLDLMDSITPEMSEEEKAIIITEATKCIANTIYVQIINDYDLANLHIIYNIVTDIETWINETQEYYETCYWLSEDRSKRVSLMKYPNGACRGMVIIPDWPTNYEDEYECANLWLNHVKTTVKLWEKHGCGWHPRTVGVIATATLMSEQDCFSPNKNTCQCGSNGDMSSSIADGWCDNPAFGVNLVSAETNPYAPDQSVFDDMYMGRNNYPTKKNMIGLYKYMGWVNENNLWTKIGKGYAIIGSTDDSQSSTKNLIPSAVIYNPNSVPIRIKYMIFA